MRVFKICMIGDFGVGKTSLVSRFVHRVFGEKYLTTVGVKIDTKTVTLNSGEDIKLVVWDIAGSDRYSAVYREYLRGAAGLLFIADGTRKPTLETAVNWQQDIFDMQGEKPWVGLLNKFDLQDEWQIEIANEPLLADQHDAWSPTSAKTGQGVEDAFHFMAHQVSSAVA